MSSSGPRVQPSAGPRTSLTAKRGLYSVIDSRFDFDYGDERYKLFAPFGLDWTGGPGGLVAAEAICRWHRFRDWLQP